MQDGPTDKHTFEVLKDIANDVIPMLQWEIDYPSNNKDSKLPVLDLKIAKNDDFNDGKKQDNS